MKDIGKKKIKKILYKYGLHQYLRKAQSDLQSLLVKPGYFWLNKVPFPLIRVANV